MTGQFLREFAANTRNLFFLSQVFAVFENLIESENDQPLTERGILNQTLVYYLDFWADAFPLLCL